MTRNAMETECEVEWVRDCLLVDGSSLWMPMMERGMDGDEVYGMVSVGYDELEEGRGKKRREKETSDEEDADNMRSICEDESGRVRCVSFPPVLIDDDGSMDPSVISCEEEVFVSHRSPHGSRHSPIRMSVPPAGDALGTEEEGEEKYNRDK